MTKRRTPEGSYEHVLKSSRNRNSLVANRLQRAHKARIERVRLVDQQIPFWFDGIDELLTGLRSVGSKTQSGELKDLLIRAEEETYRSVEAILSDDEQTLSDSSRVFMEIEVLLMEWRLEPDRIQDWGESSDQTRHARYGFGKVLERVKRKNKVDDKLEMPERKEYNIHSMTLHPYPGEPIKLLQSFDMQTSELVAHLGRIFRRTFEAVRTTGSPLEIPQDDIHLPGEAWERLYKVFIAGRDQYLWPALNKIVVGPYCWQVFEVVVEGAAGDVVGERGVGLLGGVALDVGDASFGCVPDVLDRVVVRRVRREVDRRDSL